MDWTTIKKLENDSDKINEVKTLLPDLFTEINSKFSTVCSDTHFLQDIDTAILLTLKTNELNEKYVEKNIMSHLETYETRLPWIKIMEDYHSGNNLLVSNAKNKACELLQKYIWDAIWKKYSSYAKEHREELYHEGIIGVLEGLKNFDPHKSVPAVHFWPYVTHQITDYINKIIKQSNTYFQKNIRAIKEAIEQFEEKNIPWSAKDISVATGINTETVLNCLSIIQGTESRIDVSSEEFTTAMGSQAISKSAEEAYLDSTEIDSLYEALAMLKERDANIIKIYYGIMPDEEVRKIINFPNDKEKITKKIIGDAYGIQEAEVARIINSGKRKLKNILSPEARLKKCLNDTEFAFVERKSNFKTIEIL